MVDEERKARGVLLKSKDDLSENEGTGSGLGSGSVSLLLCEGIITEGDFIISLSLLADEEFSFVI